MLSSISPYELLYASRPKPVSSFNTAYDLYSQMQNEYYKPSIQVPESTPAPSNDTALTEQAPSATKRTHYIADIHARHNAANRLHPTKRI